MGIKLRNKKTGEVWETPKMREVVVCQEDDIAFYARLGADGRLFGYKSLAELNEEWEDYKPAEPLIKDEKIRKAVRAWADANNANVVYICALAGGWGVRYDWEDDGIYSIDLLFKGNAPLGVGNQYTIDELCGTPPEPLEPAFIDLDERIKGKEGK